MFFHAVSDFFRKNSSVGYPVLLSYLYSNITFLAYSLTLNLLYLIFFRLSAYPGTPL
jgi:hypothetical protein